MPNWYFGWGLILTAFLTGAMIGLHFHRADFLGGYASWRRRLVRLGHIALAALGMINVLYGLSPAAQVPSLPGSVARVGFMIGGVMMPAACFLTAWHDSFRYLFAIPVSALVIAVVATLSMGGVP